MTEMQPNSSQRRDSPRYVPEYAERLLAFHQAHKTELRRMIRSLPLKPGARILDVACGDGTYGILMSQRGARVTSLDLEQGYLDLARKRAAESGVEMEFTLGNAEEMPFGDSTFDGAFCAQSFYSLPNVPRVLAEMQRVVRPGGFVAALENDTVHQLVLPWPPELELKLRLAEHQSLAAERGDEARYYIGRFLGAELERRGLAHAKVRCFATHRRAPFTSDERTFLAGYLEELLERALPRLTPADREQAQRIASPDSSECMLDDARCAVTYLDILACATVPSDRPASR
jgi:ubiquinone/menaquinone biosynthesis C-methylase UbiE